MSTRFFSGRELRPPESWGWVSSCPRTGISLWPWSIPHSTFWGRFGDLETRTGTIFTAPIEFLVGTGTYLVPTYTAVADLLDAGGDFDVAALRARGQHMLPRLRDTIKRAHKIGVTIVAATDTYYAPNSISRIGQEITYFVEMGFTALQAIQSATIRSAEMLRLEKSIGVLETGHEADLIAVEKNPLEDIVTIQDPLLVISNGRIALDRLNLQRATGAGSLEPSR
jgi:hypothetical protein